MSTAWVTLHCPYCGEGFDSRIDLSEGDTTYTEDCAVCCRPIVVSVRVEDDETLGEVRTRREQD
ncbi:MAG: CPXCG motif-containing cysteine-rich protein [Pseudomonadota bacterium]|jgi:hypothetical protein